MPAHKYKDPNDGLWKPVADLLMGPLGPEGPQGDAAMIEVGTVTTGASGSNAEVTNSGNSQAAVLDFVIPQGPEGPQGVGAPIYEGDSTNPPVEMQDGEFLYDPNAVLEAPLMPGDDIDAGQIATGTVDTARLGSGIADSSVFLRGDGVWDKAELQFQWSYSMSDTGGFRLDGNKTANGWPCGSALSPLMIFSSFVPSALKVSVDTAGAAGATGTFVIYAGATPSDTHLTLVDYYAGIALDTVGEKVMTKSWSRIPSGLIWAGMIPTSNETGAKLSSGVLPTFGCPQRDSANAGRWYPDGFGSGPGWTPPETTPGMWWGTMWAGSPIWIAALGVTP